MNLSRDGRFKNKVLFINGFPGCGKTLFSKLISKFDKVEIFQYSEEIERVCELFYLDGIDADNASGMCQIVADRQIYNSILGRNVNFRRSDLSSVFGNNFFRYLSRILFPIDEGEAANSICRNPPVLPLTTHMLLPSFEVVNRAFQERLVFLEIVRHPLYMFIQQSLNFKSLGRARFGHIAYKKGEMEYPFFAKGLEDEFDKCNDYERTILIMASYFSVLKEYKDGAPGLTIIPFERFVKNPNSFLRSIAEQLEVEINQRVLRELKAQKVPRKLVADGPSLRVYKKCGWVASKTSDERSELDIRAQLLRSKVSKTYMDKADEMCEWYETTFLNGDLEEA